ncbi:MarR family transcriptional regulator [Vagococcus coleopterorum]|uniref:MarR family transcriptional regulator n=1 Tax=Vagococcus coleopterorum TaxID=2714946 RepID=A0A6G8AN15_9ENTE|nr:MarR family transcriptional regulator [Vagococcus coleopterorum]QIL46458.1 MarR family transcriptional regulator [Vagococcus coleopterorum]
MKSQKHDVNGFIKSFFNYVTFLEKEMAEDDFNFNEMRIIFELWENGTVSAKSIESELALDKGYTSRLLTRLIADDIIEKKQSSEDKRFYDISFTKKGERLAASLYDKYEKIITNDYNRMDKVEQQRFLETLKVFKKIDEARES